jgi:hypothetical protein
LLTVVAIMSVCSTGCMVTPQHGQVLTSTGEEIDFVGATVHPGERLLIQARRVSGSWEEETEEWENIGEATTYTSATVLESGEWYLWRDGRVRIPSSSWWYVGDGLMAAEIRVISLDHDIRGDDRLLTFKSGFYPMAYTDPLEMWVDYGHGRTITLYAPR